MKPLPSSVSLALVSFCLLFFTFGSPGLAQETHLDRSLVASGTGPVTKQDSADARNLALKEALRSAVEQALGWLLPAESIVRFYPLLLNRILTRPMSYVQDYQIIHEAQIFGLYRVTVQTTLYAEGLKRDLRRLGLFLAAAERPRVLLMVAERVDSDDSWNWWWQIPSPEYQKSAFTEALTKLISVRGLVPLDPNLLRRVLPEDSIYQEPLLGETEGIELAKLFGAQVVILGQVSQQSARAGTPAMASGSLRALSADSRQILAKVSGSVQVQPAGDHGATDQGFIDLAERLAPHLLDGMLAPFVAGSQVQEKITLQVLGVRSYGDLVLIKQHLQQTSGVKDIKQIQLGSGGGSFTLVLAGRLDALSDAFAGQDFGSFTTSAELSGEDRVIVTIHSKR